MPCIEGGHMTVLHDTVFLFDVGNTLLDNDVVVIALSTEKSGAEFARLAQRDDRQRIVAAARCDGRDTVGCIVLGRTPFWDAVVGWQPHTLSRADTVAQIALRLREWVDTFERARAA